MQEGIPNPEETDLLKTIASESESELADEDRLSILTGDGPSADEPLALICKTVIRQKRIMPTAAPSSAVSFDPSRFSSTPFQLKFHTAAVFCVAIASDSLSLISSSKDGTIGI
jgi:hypothetical protein